MQKVASSQLLDTFERSQRCTFNQKRCHRPAREKKRENQNQINEGFVWTGDATARQSNCDMDYNACVVTRNSCWQIWNDLQKKARNISSDLVREFLRNVYYTQSMFRFQLTDYNSHQQKIQILPLQFLHAKLEYANKRLQSCTAFCGFRMD